MEVGEYIKISHLSFKGKIFIFYIQSKFLSKLNTKQILTQFLVNFKKSGIIYQNKRSNKKNHKETKI